MEVGLTRLDDKGRAVIPKRVREAAGLSKNSALCAFSLGRFVLLRRADTGPDPSDELAQALRSRRGKGTTGGLSAKKARASGRQTLPYARGEVTV
jgi:bifunctional DNA-binding transcriptional regulator/antitoxin component of YhaV-PrlF toxin-antitoxin module